MRSKSTSVKIPWILADWLKPKAEELGTNVNALHVGFIRYATLNPTALKEIAALGKLPEKTADTFDDKLIKKA